MGVKCLILGYKHKQDHEPCIIKRFLVASHQQDGGKFWEA